jgi:hypothetical protein
MVFRAAIVIDEGETGADTLVRLRGIRVIGFRSGGSMLRNVSQAEQVGGCSNARRPGEGA